MILPPPLPIHGPFHINDISQLPAHLDYPAPYHPRIYRNSLSDQPLRGRRGVEAHDEVVAAVMAHLVLFERLRKEERTPIRNAAHHAALCED